MLATRAPRLLSPAQVAVRLDVHPATVRRWIAAGELRAMRLGEGPLARIRIDTAELDIFVRPTTTKETKE